MRLASLHIGANLMLCRTVLKRFDEAIHRLVETGFKRIVLLRYKPPGSVEQWKIEAPDGQELLGMEKRIARTLARYSNIEIRLDCALSFLQRELLPELARSAGLRGCVAGARIVAIGPDGSVYPCSQLVYPRFRAGNIIEDEPEEIWSNSDALTKMRRFRTTSTFRRSACGACRASEQCGGCRIFSHEGYGPDVGCPGMVVSTEDSGFLKVAHRGSV